MFKTNIDKDLLYRLVVEFRVAFVLALFWALGYICFGVSSPVDKDVNSVVQKGFVFFSTFGAVFFFVSWATAQYFRVERHQKNDDDFKNISQSLETLDKNVSDLSEKPTKEELLQYKRKVQIGIRRTMDTLKPHICVQCGYDSPKNRPTENDFICVNCGHTYTRA